MKFSTAVLLLMMMMMMMMMMKSSTFVVVNAFITPTLNNVQHPFSTLKRMAWSEDDDDGHHPSYRQQKLSSNPTRNVAVSFVTASILAMGTLGGIPPVMDLIPNIHSQQQQLVPRMVLVPSAQAAIPTISDAANTIDMKKKQPTTTKVTSTLKKQQLSKEERERLDSKKYYDLCQQSLKEYQKFVNEVSIASKKADNFAQASIKQADQAKIAYIKQSDKLSTAKNERMPNSAIQELQLETGTLRLWLCSIVRWFIGLSIILCTNEKRAHDNLLVACCLLLVAGIEI
jgi:hypothetical protein